MNNNTNRRLVLIGLETASGELDGTLQALEVQSGLAIKPEGDVKSRDVVRPTFSKSASVIGAKSYSITLPLELKGGGLDADTGELKAPPLHPALLACGMTQEAGAILTVQDAYGDFEPGAEVTNTTTNDIVGTLVQAVPGAPGELALWLRNVQNLPAPNDELACGTAVATAQQLSKALVYRPESDRSAHRAAVLHAHYDGQRRIAKTVRGSFSFEWTAGEFCTVQFNLMGLYQSPDNVPMPAADYNDSLPPIGQSAGLRLGDYPSDIGTIEKLSFDWAADVQPVPDINSPDGRHSYRIANRAPTGSLNPESLPLDAFNPFTLWENGEKAAITATLGQAAGERISLVVTGARVTGISDTERAGSDAYDLPFEATGQNDDEFYLLFH